MKKKGTRNWSSHGSGDRWSMVPVSKVPGRYPGPEGSWCNKIRTSSHWRNFTHSHLFLTPTMSDEYTQEPSKWRSCSSRVTGCQLDATNVLQGLDWTKTFQSTKSRKGRTVNKTKEMVRRTWSCSGNTLTVIMTTWSSHWILTSTFHLFLMHYFSETHLGP